MGTTQSTTSTTLATSYDSRNDGDSIDHEERHTPNIVNKKDIFVLEGSRHLHRQSTDFLCASTGPSQDEIEDDDLDEEWNERLLILEDAANLARLAHFYLNPQKQLVPSDPYAYGRNYFTRPSAYTPHTMEGDEEEDEIQFIVHSREEERVFETCIPDAESRDSTTHLESESTWQKTETRVSLDPSCVVRFGLQYDHHLQDLASAPS